MTPLLSTINYQLSTLPLGVTQQEAFQSIQDNVADTGGAGKLLALALAAGAMIVLLAVLSRRKTRASTPKAVNHQGRLLKEVTRSIGLKSAEVRKLKSLADAQSLDNPLTLLLCPSLLAKSLKKRA